MRFREIRGPEDMISAVEEAGFLPLFANHIPGLSVEECCPRELWFSEDVDGPWEWKGPAARSGRCVYGKLFRGKAGFVSREWLPELANYRRDGYDFDARFEDGLAPVKDRQLFDTVLRKGEVLSKELKECCGYGRGRAKGFDTVITRLQMQTYITVGDFVYMRDKWGRTYGWGVAKYTTPEAQFGYDHLASAYCRDPEESLGRIVEHLRRLLPDVREDAILKLIKI